MKITINDYNAQHKIADLKVVLANGIYKVKWSYTNADGFIILSYPYNLVDFDFITYISEKINEKSDERNMQVKEDNIELLSIQRANFSANGTEVIPKREVKIPRKVIVIAYTRNDDELQLWKQLDANNSSVIQQVIKYKKIFKKGFLWFKKPKVLLHIFDSDSITDNMLYYVVDGKKIMYPINENMVGKDLSVIAQHEGQIDLCVSEEYKNYYKCSME